MRQLQPRIFQELFKVSSVRLNKKGYFEHVDTSVAAFGVIL